MLQRSSLLYDLTRAARREIELLLATDPDVGDGIEQETFILDDGALNFANQLCLKQMFAIGFRGLTPREERVLRMRCGLAGAGCHSYEEIAEAFDMTGSRIRQIELRAHQKLIKRWSYHRLWSAADTRRRESNVAQRRPKPVRPIGPTRESNVAQHRPKPARPSGPIWGLYDNARGRPLPSPVPHVPVPHVPAPDLAGISEEILAAASAEPAASRALPRPSLWSRIWNWVPGGRVAQGGFDLDSLFSSRRR